MEASSREGTHVTAANRDRKVQFTSVTWGVVSGLVHARSCDKDNTDLSDVQLTNKPLLDQLSHLAYFPLCAPLSPPVVSLPTFFSQGWDGCQATGTTQQPGSPLSGPPWFQSKSESVCAFIYWTYAMKKGAVNSFRLIGADGKSPFSSRGPPLDSSVNMVLHSLGICGGAANPGHIFF